MKRFTLVVAVGWGDNAVYVGGKELRINLCLAAMGVRRRVDLS